MLCVAARPTFASTTRMVAPAVAQIKSRRNYHEKDMYHPFPRRDELEALATTSLLLAFRGSHHKRKMV